jgi:hypothetical protein
VPFQRLIVSLLRLSFLDGVRWMFFNILPGAPLFLRSWVLVLSASEEGWDSNALSSRPLQRRQARHRLAQSVPEARLRAEG